MTSISNLVNIGEKTQIEDILSKIPLTDEILLELAKLPKNDLIDILVKHLSSSWAPSDLTTITKFFQIADFEAVIRAQQLNSNFNVTNIDELGDIIDGLRKKIVQGQLSSRNKIWKTYDAKLTEYFSNLDVTEKTEFVKLRRLLRGWFHVILPQLAEKIYLTSKLPIPTEGFKLLNEKYGQEAVTRIILSKAPEKIYVVDPQIVREGILDIPVEIQELLTPVHTLLSGGSVLAALTNNFEQVTGLQPSAPNHPFAETLPEYVRDPKEDDAVQDYDIYTDLPIETVWKHFNNRGYRTVSHNESDEKTVSYTGWLLRLVKYDESRPKEYIPKTKIDVIFTNRYLSRYETNFMPSTPQDFIEKEFDLDIAKVWYDGSRTMTGESDVKRKIENREFGLSFNEDMTINVHKTKTTATRIMKYISRGFVFNQTPKSTLARYITNYALRAFSPRTNYELIDPASTLEVCIPYITQQLPEIKSYNNYFNRTTNDKFEKGIPRPSNPPPAPTWWTVLRNAVEKFPKAVMFENVFKKLGLNVYSFAYSMVLARTVRLPETFDDEGITDFLLTRILDVPDETEFSRRVEIFMRKDVFNRRSNMFVSNQDLKERVDFATNPPFIMRFFQDKYEKFEIVGTRAALTDTEANKVTKYSIEPLVYLPKKLLNKAIVYFDSLPPNLLSQDFNVVFSDMLETKAHKEMLLKASRLGLKEIVPLFEGWMNWRTEDYRARARDYIMQIKADRQIFETYLPNMKFPELYPSLFSDFFEDRLSLAKIMVHPDYKQTEFFIHRKSSMFDAVEKVFDCLRKMAEFATFVRNHLSDQATLDRIAKWEGWMCWEVDSFESIVDPPCMYFDQIKSIFENPLIDISKKEYETKFVNVVSMKRNSSSKSQVYKAVYASTGEKVFLKTFETRVSPGLDFESRIYQYITFMDRKLNGILKDFIITSPADPFIIELNEQVTVTYDYEDSGSLLDASRSPFFANRLLDIMFDVLYINYLYNYRLKIKHNDAHFGNYRFKALSSKRQFTYVIGNKTFVKEKDWEIRGYDFDQSSQFIDNFMIKENIFLENFCSDVGSCNYYSQKDIHFIVASAYASLWRSPMKTQIREVCQTILNDNQVLEEKIIDTATKRLNKNVFWSEFCDRIFDFGNEKNCAFTYYPDLDVDKVIERFLTKYPPTMLGMKEI